MAPRPKNGSPRDLAWRAALGADVAAQHLHRESVRADLGTPPTFNTEATLAIVRELCRELGLRFPGDHES